MSFRLPFGKHKGEPIEDVPTEYLDYLLGLDNLYADTRQAIEREKTRRDGGGPTHPHGTGRVVPPAVRQAAIAIIQAGQEGYAPKCSAEKLTTLNQAAEMLRGWVRSAP